MQNKLARRERLRGEGGKRAPYREFGQHPVHRRGEVCRYRKSPDDPPREAGGDIKTQNLQKKRKGNRGGKGRRNSNIRQGLLWKARRLHIVRGHRKTENKLAKGRGRSRGQEEEAHLYHGGGVKRKLDPGRTGRKSGEGVQTEGSSVELPRILDA